MALKAHAIRLRQRSLDLLAKLDFLPPLLARLSLGWVFFRTGWGKLNNLAGVIEYFDSLGIPAAKLQAPFIASLEFVGGILLLLGLGTRLFSALLASTMVVAILTALRADIHGFGDLAKLSEFHYILLFAYLVVWGPGRASLDAIIAKRLSNEK